MKDFWIRYGSVNSKECCEWEKITAKDLEQATEVAWIAACEDFESYEGLHGTRDVTMIMEEDDIEEDEAWDVYADERESYLDYDVREEKPDDFEDD